MVKLKYGDTFQPTAYVIAAILLIPIGLLIWLGGTVVAITGYEDNPGSIVGGMLWLFLIGPLVAGLATIPVVLASVFMALPIAFVIWIGRLALQPYTGQARA